MSSQQPISQEARLPKGFASEPLGHEDLQRQASARLEQPVEGHDPLRLSRVGEVALIATSPYQEPTHEEVYCGKEDVGFIALERYGEFKPLVETLRNELSQLDDVRDHPSFLGGVTLCSAYELKHPSGHYVIRFPGKEINDSEWFVRGHVESAVLGNGVNHLEQLVAASYEDAVLVTQFIPGKEVEKLESDEVSLINDKHLIGLIRTLAIATEKGIEIDPSPSNFFYDEKEGFGIIDYWVAPPETDAYEEFVKILGRTAKVFYILGTEDFCLDPSEYQKSHEFNRSLADAKLHLLKRYQALVDGLLVGKSSDVARENIQDAITRLTNDISEYDADEQIDYFDKSRTRSKDRRKAYKVAA